MLNEISYQRVKRRNWYLYPFQGYINLFKFGNFSLSLYIVSENYDAQIALRNNWIESPEYVLKHE